MIQSNAQGTGEQGAAGAAPNPGTGVPAVGDQGNGPQNGQQGNQGEQGKPPEGSGQGTAPAGAPQAYAWTLPDGVSLDKDQLGKFEGLLREGNVPQEFASKLLAFQLEREKAAVEAATQARERRVSELRAETAKKFTPDQIEKAKSAFRAFGDDEIAAFYEENGLGDDPRQIATWLRIAEKVGNHEVVRPLTSQTPVDPLAKLYPSTAGK